MIRYSATNSGRRQAGKALSTLLQMTVRWIVSPGLKHLSRAIGTLKTSSSYWFQEKLRSSTTKKRSRGSQKGRGNSLLNSHLSRAGCRSRQSPFSKALQVSSLQLLVYHLRTQGMMFSWAMEKGDCRDLQ